VGIIKVFLQPGANVDARVAQLTAVAQTILRQMPPGQTPPAHHSLQRVDRSDPPIRVHQRELSEQEVADLTLNQVRVGVANIPGAQIPWPYGGRMRTGGRGHRSHRAEIEEPPSAGCCRRRQCAESHPACGYLEDWRTEYNIEVNSSPRVLDDLNNVPIRVVNGATIYLA
jgi:hypothetical protein